MYDTCIHYTCISLIYNAFPADDMNLDHAYIDSSQPKRRKLYQRDPTRPVPKQTLCYTPKRTTKGSSIVESSGDDRSGGGPD